MGGGGNLAGERARPRKVALCVGINDYPGSDADLAGCVNDAQDWALALGRRGYGLETLLDGQATKDAIVDRLRTMISQARFGDRVVFTYSGHGTWVPDRDGDEADGRDEALVCHDYQRGLPGLLVDDELQAIFALRRRGVRLLVISDSCHSGSVSRFAPVLQLAQAWRPRFLPPGALLDGQDLERAKAVEGRRARSYSRAGAVLMSGCADHEFSWDANFAGRPNGAMTYFALKTLGTRPGNLREWHRRIRHELPSERYPQTPQLTATTDQKCWEPLA